MSFSEQIIRYTRYINDYTLLSSVYRYSILLF